MADGRDLSDPRTPGYAPESYNGHTIESDLEIDGEVLLTWEKLRILAEADPRAGFLPLSHREKFWAITMLDLLATDERTSRVPLYLNRIFLVRQSQTRDKLTHVNEAADQAEPPTSPLSQSDIKQHAQNAGREAVISVAGEFIDFFRGAEDRERTLREMDEESRPLFPGLTLAEAFPGALGVDMLIQYRDLRDLLKTGYQNSLLEIDPLQGTEDRSAKEVIGDVTKNKVATSVYSLAHRSEKLLAHLSVQASTLTIRDVRSDFASAISNEVSRGNFWLRVLRESMGHGAARIVISQVLRGKGISFR